MFEDKYREYQEELDKALQEMVDFLQEDYSCLDDDDCTEIIEEHGHEIEDIKGAYTSMVDAVRFEAYGLGYVTDVSEEYFNWEAFQEDSKENENYIELSSGVVIYVSR